MKYIKKFFALVSIALIIAASGLFGSYYENNSNNINPGHVTQVKAATATTYTQTYNADNILVNAPDAYEPGSTYDTIGLETPQEMFIHEEEAGDIVYILNTPSGGASPFLIKMNLSAENPASTVEKITLPFAYMNTPTGLWIVNINGTDWIYISDAKASFTIYSGDTTRQFTFTGLIYMAELNNLSHYKIITEPAIEKAGGITERSPSFGSKDLTNFEPSKISVDNEGKIYVASPSTGAGLILLSNAYLDVDKWGPNSYISSEFISFFAVNAVQYNLLYYLVKTFGTEKQLKQIDIPEPVGFTNVFIDNKNLTYSMTTKPNNADTSSYPSFTKHKTDGSSMFAYNVIGSNSISAEFSDITVSKDGILFVADQNGLIYVYGPDGDFIYLFGSSEKTKPDIVGFFEMLRAIGVDSQDRIWAIDQSKNLIQSFNPTDYTKNIFEAIISFENHEYEKSRKAWENVLVADELSVFANDGIGKAYYYDLQFDEAAKYFSISKNRSLYSEAFWEIRNNWLQSNLAIAVVILVAIVAVLVGLHYLFKCVPVLANFKGKAKTTVTRSRIFKDLTVGFRLIRKPVDTFYELKTGQRGSVLGATLYYILGLIIFTWYMYGKALPFQYFNENTMYASIVIFGFIGVIAIFIICNYLVSAIKNGEGTFKNIYKFTGYSLLPLIVLLPIAVGLSYILTLTEQVIMDLLFQVALWGTIFFVIVGILETHNYTFKQTFWNVILTIIFMVLFVIICLTILLMFDQVSTLIESITREVKLRAGWY